MLFKNLRVQSHITTSRTFTILFIHILNFFRYITIAFFVYSNNLSIKNM